jgi:hypothetical protein
VVAGGAFLKGKPVTKFTVQCETLAPYRHTVVVEADNFVAACRAGIDAAGDDDGWKSVASEQSTYIVAIAQGDDVDPWTLDASGADISVIPVPPVFADIAQIIGYAATRADDLVVQLRIMIDACRADGALRIDPAAMQRLCATGAAMLADIDQCGLG